MNKLEFPSPKDDLCQVWLKLAQWFWRRKILKFVNVFLLFRTDLPLDKDLAHYLIKLESLASKDALCHVWLKLAQWFWRRRWKCEKFTTTTTDNGKAHLSLNSERNSDRIIVRVFYDLMLMFDVTPPTSYHKIGVRVRGV